MDESESRRDDEFILHNLWIRSPLVRGARANPEEGIVLKKGSTFIYIHRCTFLWSSLFRCRKFEWRTLTRARINRLPYADVVALVAALISFLSSCALYSLNTYLIFSLKRMGDF